MSARKRGVLVVDDDAGFAALATDYFRARGFEAWTATGFEDALELFRRHRPGVVLLDLNMPLVNGDRFLPLLQEIEPRVRAIVVSGCLKEEVEERFAGLGYYAFFEKGTLSLDQVKEKVDEAYGSL